MPGRTRFRLNDLLVCGCTWLIGGDGRKRRPAPFSASRMSRQDCVPARSLGAVTTQMRIGVKQVSLSKRGGACGCCGFQGALALWIGAAGRLPTPVRALPGATHRATERLGECPTCGFFFGAGSGECGWLDRVQRHYSSQTRKTYRKPIKWAKLRPEHWQEHGKKRLTWPIGFW